MDKGTFKLSFKPINVANAIHILAQDLNNDQMSDEIIREIGEVFIKHMFYKVYENNENLKTEGLPNEFDENKMDIENSSQSNNENNSESQSNYIPNFNEIEEKKKLMKYLALGWYIYTYCI